MLPKKILVLRFSAMGDVMLLAPVLKSLKAAYPNLDITIVTRPRFAGFFTNIKGLKIFEADVDHTYKGFFGLRDLFKALMMRGDYDLILDLHDHMRTMILRNFFKIIGKKIIVFSKGRSEKKAFVRKENKIIKQLPHTVERYHAAFQKAGFTFPILEPPYLLPDKESKEKVDRWLEEQHLVKEGKKWIGIAPFAMHASKIWPKQNYEPLLDLLLRGNKVHIFFFGGGDDEIDFFQNLQKKFPGKCTIVAGQLKIRHEIALLPHINLMLCVDSSNMHLAVLTGTPLLSIWGGTHPDVGFGPFRHGEDSIVQIPRTELGCRPCSVYGKETCWRGDFACLNQISAVHIAEEIKSRLYI